MPHDVIMPALGMAQDTGLLVAWRKAPGDPVAPGDVLFEVETDKATMEVEATAAGFLSGVTAAAGQDVPVGHVIAQIVATGAEVKAASAAVAAPEAAPASVVPPAAVAPPPTAAPRPAALPATPGRILASPKARRLAAERGIDLARLAAAGHPQPYHVADLDRMPTLAGGSRAILTARAGAGALDALLAKASPSTDRARLFAAFAMGAWRMAAEGGDLAITLLRADGTLDSAGGDGMPLLLADLTATRLTGYVPQEGGLSLSVARDAGGFVLTLAFDEGDLPFAAAARWLDELAARIEDPVRQLV